MRTNTQITLLTRGITPRIDRPQFEDGTELGLMVMDTDISGYSAQIYEKKSDGTVVYNSCEIEDNTIVVTLDNQMTASEGENKFTIRLTKSGHETFAFPLILNIIGVPFSGEESHSESSILQQFIDEAEGYADDAHNSAVDANASKNAAKAYYDNLASFGTKNHSIMDSNGSPMPARDTLQFANSRVKDDSANNKTIVAPAHGHTNLLNPTADTTTINGVTCTKNSDGTYTLTGTATGWVTLDVCTVDVVEGVSYRLVGCPSGGSGTTYRMGLYTNESSPSSVIQDLGTGRNWVSDRTATLKVRIVIQPNYAISGSLVFKLMLTTDLSVGYDDFVAYSGDGELNENVASLYEGLESTDANLANVQSQIVTSGNIESGNTATSAHTVGTYIQWKGKFYVVTAAIAVGDTLAVGTNLAEKTVGEVLTQINADLSDMLLDGSIYQTVVDDVITANYTKTTQITMPKNGRIFASCGAANNNTTSLNALTISLNDAYDIYKEITTNLYSEHKIITPVIKKGTTVSIQCILNASDWNSARYGRSKILIL